jgi:hypothetical protein
MGSSLRVAPNGRGALSLDCRQVFRPGSTPRCREPGGCKCPDKGVGWLRPAALVVVQELLRPLERRRAAGPRGARLGGVDDRPQQDRARSRSTRSPRSLARIQTVGDRQDLEQEEGGPCQRGSIATASSGSGTAGPAGRGSAVRCLRPASPARSASPWATSDQSTVQQLRADQTVVVYCHGAP